MDALILSCSTGGGHNAAAYAMKTALEEKGWRVHFFDPYSLTSARLSDSISSAYLSVVGFSPALFGRIYKLGEFYENAQEKYHLVNPLLALQRHPARALKKWLETNSADVIICTHPFPAYMLTKLKRQGFALPVTIMIATDYTCIPFEKEVETDFIVIPAPALISQFLSGHFHKEQILPFGIPVSPAFCRIDNDETDDDLPLFLKKDQKLILVAAGSMGLKSTFDLARTLAENFIDHPDIHIAALCGSNRDLKKQLENLQLPNVSALGYTDKMPQLLKRTSVYVTKPGGLSITEAAAVNVPMVLIHPIPGCESENAKFFTENKMAFLAESNEEAVWCCRDLMAGSDGLFQEKMQKRTLPSSAALHLAAWIDHKMILQKKEQQERMETEF